MIEAKWRCTKNQEIEMILDIYQIFLANTNLNYNVDFDALHGKNFICRSNKMLSGVFKGFPKVAIVEETNNL